MAGFFKAQPEKEPPKPVAPGHDPAARPGSDSTTRLPVVPPTTGGTGRTLSRHEVEVIAQDMASAAEFQKFLLPKAVPQLPGYDFAVQYLGSRPVSGDHYDFIDHGVRRDVGDFGRYLAGGRNCGPRRLGPSGPVSWSRHVQPVLRTRTT